MTAYASAPDPTKVMGRRYGAYIVDSIIGLVIAFVVFGATVETATVGRNPCPDPVSDSTNSAQFCMVGDAIVLWDGNDAVAFEFGDTTIVWLATLAYSVLVYAVLQGLTGATPGKALFGIRTVNAQGNAPGIGRAALRTILLIVDTIGCCVPLVGPIAAGVSKGHRRVGDMAAGTYVVGKASVGYEVAIPGVTPPPAVGAGFPPAPGYPPAPGFPPADPYATAVPPAGTPDPSIGWGAPTPPAEAPGAAFGVAEATPGDAPASSPGEPQWDEARNAYIQWDATQQTWLQFDDATQQWRPIQ